MQNGAAATRPGGELMSFQASAHGRIGDLEVATVHDCTLHDTAAHWFPDFDREAIRPHASWLCPDHLDAETGAFEMPVHSFVLRVGGRVVLIDTCVGSHKERPQIGDMHRLDTGYLDRLAALGLAPEDVDVVLCTHLHVDHVGWNTRLLDGRWVPTFPNARYVFSRTEYEAAYAEAARPDLLESLRNCFADSILPVVEAGRVELVDGAHEVLAGLTIRPAPGHSPGHVRIEARSAGQIGVFAGDMLHSPLQVPFWRWSSIACWDRAMAAEARRDLLAFCASENALLLPGHFKAPFAGRVHEHGDTFGLRFGW
jgi:glyoxylase-like metal-dependent hydrolase (beta-lactamase superfamily II)